ncbi:MAG: hypothetical protein JSW34_06690 [Candidatus Zixiibacteriota bacterium]|nr:MAG: hypothetical protein JSW34_06690 [candidate division Zixibacteria bacterium]
MRTVALSAVVLVVLLGGGAPHAQELSTDIFPSEDEIYQALCSGDITYQQYLILQELLATGIDSSNAHLLDQIPNLNFFYPEPDSLASELEREQTAAFSRRHPQSALARNLSGSLSHRYYQYLEEGGDARYRSSLRLNYGRNLQMKLDVRREYTGYERITSRSLNYRSREGLIRQLYFGSYSMRLGLGTIYGYRGKLLSYAHSIDSESFLYPDYGGYNGAAARLSGANWNLQVLSSFNRDDDFRLTSTGVMFQLTALALSPAIIVGFNRLANRQTATIVNDVKYGLSLKRESQSGYDALETSWQAGERSSFGAGILEGRQRFRWADLKYAGWLYSDQYIDLTGGSKTAAIYRKDTLDTAAFDYSTRRAGQHGGLLKSGVTIHRSIQLSGSILYASLNADTTNLEWLTELTRKQGDFTLGLEHLSRRKRRCESEEKRKTIKRQTRLVGRWRREKFYFRTYIGYNSRTGEPDFLAFFVGLRYKSDSYGQLRLWSNLSQFDHRRGRIDYWYGYIENSFRTIAGVSLGIKLSHCYRRGAADRHRTTISFDLDYSF